MVDLNKEFKNARNVKTKFDRDYIDMHPNLQNYIRQGKYPPDADEKSFLKSNKCTFCNNPASKQFQVNGYQFGVILKKNPICNKCLDVISNIPMPVQLAPDECYRCAEIYPIPREVFKVREQKLTLGEHWCPNCLAEEGLEGTVYISHKECPTCGKKHEWDYTLTGEMFSAKKHCTCQGISPQLKLLELIQENNILKLTYNDLSFLCVFDKVRYNQLEDKYFKVILYLLISKEIYEKFEDKKRVSLISTESEIFYGMNMFFPEELYENTKEQYYNIVDIIRQFIKLNQYGSH